MRIFKSKIFHKWTKELHLSDDVLRQVINEMQQGAFEANLGGNIYKKRIALPGKGKSGGVRTIIAFKKDNRAFFIYGYEKSVRSTITDTEEDALKELAKLYFSFTDKQIEQAIKAEKIIEVMI